MNETVYITTANAASIVTRIDPKTLTQIEGAIYKRTIYVFSQRDKARLIAIQSLFRNPEQFITHYYKPIVKEDTGSYVFEGGHPAFHCVNSCERLNSDYTNYEIPPQIKVKGKEAITAFRKWFKANMALLEERSDYFQLRFNAEFGFWIDPKRLERPNSGITDFEDLDLAGLESRIDAILKVGAQMYRSTDRNNRIISKWGKYSWLGRSEKPLDNNNTGIADEDVKAYLREYEDAVIRPLKKYLIEYYKVKYNPEMSFQGTLLGQLGFSPCSVCHGAKAITPQEI